MLELSHDQLLHRHFILTVNFHQIYSSRYGRHIQSISCCITQVSGLLFENSRLAETRDALIPPLMSGKLHVSDVPATIEEGVI